MVNFGKIILAEAVAEWDYLDYEALKAALEAAQSSNDCSNFPTLLQNELQKGQFRSYTVTSQWIPHFLSRFTSLAQ